MTDNLQAALGSGRRRRATASMPLAATIAALAILTTPAAQAKQSCSTAAGAQGYWSWRMIDGRKCWYEGKPMLSKDLLEWPAEAAAQADADAETVAPARRKAADPMNAQASVPPEPALTFDALWRQRIEQK